MRDYNLHMQMCDIFLSQSALSNFEITNTQNILYKIYTWSVESTKFFSHLKNIYFTHSLCPLMNKSNSWE